MKAALPLFRFLLAAKDRGEATALVTITDVDGGSSRAPGTHLAVAEGGDWIGSLSGGCIEAAVIAEAQRVIASGVAETVRFGSGSRFIDIRLPCGGAIDLLITPCPPHAALLEICDRLAARQSVAVRLDVAGGLSCMLPVFAESSGWRGDAFVACHDPDLRLLIIGQGAETSALACLGMAHGALVEVYTPDRMLADRMADQGITSHVLKTPKDGGALIADAFSAVVALFHDHDWELDLLARALAQRPFYVGAMGSRETHRRRLKSLIALGVSELLASRVVGPIGFLPASRDPDTLALSVLGEIVARQQRPCGPDRDQGNAMKNAHPTDDLAS